MWPAALLFAKHHCLVPKLAGCNATPKLISKTTSKMISSEAERPTTCAVTDADVTPREWNRSWME
jgi:hypothetical protein